MEGTMSFENLPEEIKKEILSQTPPRSLAKFMLVSKKWESMIRSLPRPRVLFATNNVIAHGACQVLLRSYHQEVQELFSSGENHMTIPLERRHTFSPPIRGLICIQEIQGTRIKLCNPATGVVRDLPMLEPDESLTRITTHLGYEERDYVFKVLCVRAKHQRPFNHPRYEVYTVGSGEVSWRRIICKFPHIPIRHGVSDDRGCLYYFAYSNYDSSKNIMMSFRIRSEDFHPIPPPDGVDLNTGVWRFVKYQGEIALVDDDKGLIYEPNGDAYLQTWVRLRYSFDWEMKRILIAKWRTYAHDPPNEYGYYNHFRGTVGTGELVFAPIRVTEDGSLDVILYDTTTQTFRKSSKVQLLGGGHEDRSVETFLDHVDSPLPI